MKKWIFTLVLLVGTPSIRAATSMALTTCSSNATCSGTTITTALAWDNCGQAGAGCTTGLYSYSGTTVTVSGSSCTSGAPCTWTIADQNGTTITTLSASAGASTAWPTTVETPPAASAIVGQVDCTGSAANTVCVYRAPHEWPTGETATITINGGANGNATVTVNFNFDHNLQEYFKHRARILGFQSKPVSVLLSGSIYQPEAIIFQSTNAAASVAEEQFLEFDNGTNGTGFPITAGTSINRPAWTYDGKWFTWSEHRCLANAYCATNQTNWFLVQSNGSNLQRFSPATANLTNFTYSLDKPNWILSSDASNILVLDLANSFASTSIATYTGGSGTCTSSSTIRCFYSYPSGRYASLRLPNQSACSPIQQSCSTQIYIYDLLACESSLTASCATQVGTWNANQGLSGYDQTGAAHCTIDGGGSNCEFHFHDWFMRRGGYQDTWWLYGLFSGGTGEAIFWKTSGNGTGTVQVSPNQGTANAPYFSHPGNNWSGDLMEYGGAKTCTPSGNTCTDASAGEGIWDFRLNRDVIFDSGASVGHTAWDGFDNNVHGFDGFCSSNAAHWCLNVARASWSATSTPGTTTRYIVFDYGNRDHDSGGNSVYSLILGPTQSPDATKIAESMHTSYTNANRSEGYVIVENSPKPPVRLRLTSSSAATLGWFAHPLNHETQNYFVYKQASCSGAWSRLAGVAAVYLQATEYTYTDSALSSGQNACYGASSAEWSGIEGNLLSNVIKVTNTSGTFTSAAIVGAGTAFFGTTAPAAATAFTATSQAINVPAVGQSITATTGGSLAAGTYWATFVYCNFVDFPANTAANAKCTTKAPASSVVISGANNAFTYQTNVNAGGQGQIGLQVYACGPNSTECAETLQTCNGQSSSTIIMTIPPPTNYLGYVSCTINSISAGSSLPGTNQTKIGYNLSWTKSTDDGSGANDVRYYAIYSNDLAAPALSQSAYIAQLSLIAVAPAGSTGYLDYTPNWYRIYNSSGGPHYGIVAVDRLGNRSAGVCYNAGTGASETCN